MNLTNLGTVEVYPTAIFKHRVDGIEAFNFALGVVFGFGFGFEIALTAANCSQT